MNTDVIPLIVAIAVFTILAAPCIYLLIRHPPKPIDPCKVIEAIGIAVEEGRKQMSKDATEHNAVA